MKNQINYVKELQKTCSHLASCTKGATFTPTKYGGVFSKGNRKISCDIDYKKKFGDYKGDFDIKKTQNGFGLKMNKNSCMNYTSIQQSVYKGLGIK